MDLRVEPLDLAFEFADGYVEYAGYYGGCGGTVQIKHDNGYSSRMCHLEYVYADMDTEISAGELVGLVGDSGNTKDGEHLHIEVLSGSQWHNILHLISWR